MQGEKRTREASEALKAAMNNQFESLSLSALDFSNPSNYVTAIWGDKATEVAAAEAGIPGASGLFIPTGVRERKRQGAYNESGLLGTARPDKREAGFKKPILKRPPQMHDFQFYARGRIEELFAKDNELTTLKRELLARLKVRPGAGGGRNESRRCLLALTRAHSPLFRAASFIVECPPLTRLRSLAVSSPSSLPRSPPTHCRTSRRASRASTAHG